MISLQIDHWNTTCIHPFSSNKLLDLLAAIAGILFTLALHPFDYATALVALAAVLPEQNSTPGRRC